jgi:hypothetical protein
MTVSDGKRWYGVGPARDDSGGRRRKDGMGLWNGTSSVRGGCSSGMGWRAAVVASENFMVVVRTKPERHPIFDSVRLKSAKYSLYPQIFVAL